MSTTLSVRGRAAPDSGRSVAALHSPWLELGLGIVVIGVPLAFLPLSSAPFVNVKLVLLMLGVLAVWRGRPRARKLALSATVWIAAATLAGLVGVDRWWSLTGPENSGTGLLLLGASAFLLVAGASTPASIRGRIPLWLVGVCTAVATVSLLDRLLPGTLAGLLGGLKMDGSTLGEPVFLAALMAAGVAAAVGLDRLRLPALVPILVVLTSALALSTKRVGWISLAVGLAVALWRTRPARRRSLVIVGVVAATLLTWTAVDAFGNPGAPISGARRFSQLATGSAQARAEALTGLGRAWRKRPVFGWGPGNTWSAHLSSAEAFELRFGERGVGDAHNLLVESAVTTGVVGLAALLVLCGSTLRHTRKGPRSMGWAAGAATALAVGHLLQPLNISLTPLLFLLAGLAGPSPPSDDGSGSAEPKPAARRRRWTPVTVGRTGARLLLAGALGVSLLLLVASALEGHGRKYASEWALRASLKIAPSRVSAAEELALHLAFDGRSGDTQAAREAVALATRTVRLHPWNPGVRLAAADVYLMLRNPEAAAVWLERQRARFPGDPVLPGGVQDPSGNTPH